MSDGGHPSETPADAAAPGAGRLPLVLERRAEWVEALIILTTIAASFVVLGFLASYFQDYFRIILIFFFAWLLAFLVSPVADWLQRRLTRLPRPVAVIAVIVPVIVVCALVIVKVLISLVDSFVGLTAALPGLAANPPTVLADIQSWFDARGIDVDVVGVFHAVVEDLLRNLADAMVALLGGLVSSFGTFIDAIVVISLAVFMAIDRDSAPELRKLLGPRPDTAREA